jgi:hypothetical protein
MSKLKFILVSRTKRNLMEYTDSLVLSCFLSSLSYLLYWEPITIIVDCVLIKIVFSLWIEYMKHIA